MEDGKELIRRQLRDAHMLGGVPRDKADLIADLSIHAVETTLTKLNDVAASAGSDTLQLAVSLAAMQILRAELDRRITETTAFVKSIGLPHGEHEIGRAPQ